jgi:hypothetical protein
LRIHGLGSRVQSSEREILTDTGSGFTFQVDGLRSTVHDLGLKVESIKPLTLHPSKLQRMRGSGFRVRILGFGLRIKPPLSAASALRSSINSVSYLPIICPGRVSWFKV